MKTPFGLEPAELRELVGYIQDLLWNEDPDNMTPTWNPDKEWQCIEYLSDIATLLESYGLKPGPSD